MGMDDKPLGYQCQEEADDEASRHVNYHRPVGKACPIALDDPATHKIPGITAKKAADTDQEIRHAESLCYLYRIVGIVAGEPLQIKSALFPTAVMEFLERFGS